MTHMRKQIRDAALTALTGLPTAGTNVFSGRISDLKATEMPALLVYANADDGTDGAHQGGATNQHALTLKVECVAQGSDELIDTLDRLSLEVETALFADADFLALLMIEPGQPSTTIVIADLVQGAARRTGSAHMLFPLSYRTRQGDPAIQV